MAEKEAKERSKPLRERYEDNQRVLDRQDHLSGVRLTGDDLTDTLMEEEREDPPFHTTLLADRKTDLPDTGIGSGHHKYHNVPATDIDHYQRHPDEDSNKTQLELLADLTYSMDVKTVRDATTGAPRLMRKPLNAED